MTVTAERIAWTDISHVVCSADIDHQMHLLTWFAMVHKQKYLSKIRIAKTVRRVDRNMFL